MALPLKIYSNNQIIKLRAEETSMVEENYKQFISVRKPDQNQMYNFT